MQLWRRGYFCWAWSSLSLCHSASLQASSQLLVSAESCTVLLSVRPPAVGKAVAWEHRSDPCKAMRPSSSPTLWASPPSPPTPTSTTPGSTGGTSRCGCCCREDDGLCRFRTELQAAAWLQPRVTEPLSEPKILGEAGGGCCAVLPRAAGPGQALLVAEGQQAAGGQRARPAAPQGRAARPPRLPRRRWPLYVRGEQ